MNNSNKLSNQAKVNHEVSAISTAIFGALANPSDTVRALSHIVSGAIEGRLTQHMKESFERLLKNGSIDKEYFNQPFVQNQFAYIVDQLNKDVVDENRVRCLINIFVNSASATSEEIDNLRTQALMAIMVKLDTTDIFILSKINELRNKSLTHGSDPLYDQNASSWTNLILNKTNLEVFEIVLSTEEKLMDLKVITGRLASDRSGVEVNMNYRLTEMGVRLCELMANP